MDGVLINSEPLWEKAETQLLKSKGVTYDPLFRDRVIGLSQRELSELIIGEFGLDCSVSQLIDERMEFLFRIYDKELEMFDGAKSVIESVRKSGMKTAIASTSPMNVIEYVLGKFSLSGLFDAVVSGDCVEKGKPSPDIYLLAAEGIGVAPADCAAIEDSPRGVRAAISAGMFCIAIPDKRLKEDGFGISNAVCADIREAGEMIVSV